jgi:hypothetical protein
LNCSLIFLGYHEDRDHKWYILEGKLVYAFYLDGVLFWIRQPLEEVLDNV